MANKIIQEKELEYVREEDLIEKVDFNIDKDAFKGPFICCNKETVKKAKVFSIRNINFNYEVWHCNECGADYLDSSQGKIFDKILIIEKLFNNQLIDLERSVNFDGKTFFVRFPKELTRQWKKRSHAHIKVLGPDEYLVKVES